MSNTTIDEFNRDDLLRIIKRDQVVKDQLSQRLAGLIRENIELLALLQEAQSEAHTHEHEGNGPVPHQHDDLKVPS